MRAVRPRSGCTYDGAAVGWSTAVSVPGTKNPDGTVIGFAAGAAAGRMTQTRTLTNRSAAARSGSSARA